MRTVSVEERRLRLGRRQHLARPAAEVESVADALSGLHSSDPLTPYLSACRRVAGFEPAHLETALYERRSLVRMLGMRRTMFVVTVDQAAVMDAACTRALAAGERRRLVHLVEEQGLADDGESWLAGVEEDTLAALSARGEATAVELTSDVPELGLQLSFGEGKRGGHRGDLHPAAVPPGHGGKDRPRPAAGVVAVEPAPVGAHRLVDRRWVAEPPR